MLKLETIPTAHTNPKFRATLMTTLGQFRKPENHTVVQVDVGLMRVWGMDFDGYLKATNVPSHLWWLTRQLNSVSVGTVCEKEKLLIPSEGYYRRLLSLSTAVTSKV